ncbi:hypothetical protein ATANTOWER_019590, partial [Ataeniobius toweri]|nr:hypothetical protein [Ataeniobius toweri]
VGDIIDVIAKPPMGTWTGLLNGRIGNFKFIYVDVLTHSSGTNLDEVKETSAVQEVLRRLSLEEYFSSLHLNGYQTVDDLMKLRERNLVELNVTDPEHRERLLTAVHSLQQLDSEMSRDVKRDMNSCPRDSGCLETSDSPENCTEDTDPHFLPEYTAMSDILHPVCLILHPITFRRLAFKGPSAMFILTCQLSSSLLHPTSTIFLPISSRLPRSLAANPPPVSDQGEVISKSKPHRFSS